MDRAVALKGEANTSSHMKSAWQVFNPCRLSIFGSLLPHRRYGIAYHGPLSAPRQSELLLSRNVVLKLGSPQCQGTDLAAKVLDGDAIGVAITIINVGYAV